MGINWFPGHMNKARRMLKERVAKSDMVIEVLDARLPRSSRNPMLEQLCRGKPCLRVLTKPDLADPAVTTQWLSELQRDGARTLELIATDPKSSRRLVQACRALVPKRGHAGFPVRVMIAGIPNVGKSTLFNLLVGKKKAAVRDQPAVTRCEQRIDVPGGLSLVDTPGVLWPRLSDRLGAYRLAASGAIRDSVFDSVEVGRYITGWLGRTYPQAISERFKIEHVADDPEEALLQIAERRGCITRGKGPDSKKAAEMLLHELRAGKLGRISFEAPGDPEESLPTEAPPPFDEELLAAERQYEQQLHEDLQNEDPLDEDLQAKDPR
jgi:ribosome biogenesis GTPase A